MISSTRPRVFRLLAALLVVLTLVLGGCSETGDPAEYDRIAAVNDCGELQRMLDEYNASEQASDAAGDEGTAGEFRSYGDAVERRLETLNCD